MSFLPRVRSCVGGMVGASPCGGGTAGRAAWPRGFRVVFLVGSVLPVILGGCYFVIVGVVQERIERCHLLYHLH